MKYVYQDFDGSPVMRKVRKSGKSFYWESFRPATNEWVGGKDHPLPYNLPGIRAAIEVREVVFVTEGEKGADRLIELGLTATTTGGAKTWKDELAHYFDGAKVVIFPDNDEPGEEYADAVATSLHARGQCDFIKVIRLPGIAPKADVFDFMEQDIEAKFSQIFDLLTSTPDYRPRADSEGPNFRRGWRPVFGDAPQEIKDFVARAESGATKTFLCPLHDDKRKSLSVSIAEDEKVLWFCHAGCDQTELSKAMAGLSNRPESESDPEAAGEEEDQLLPQLNEWMQPIVPAKADLAEVLDDMVAWLKRFVVCSREEDYIACALYAAATWRYQDFDYAPILYIMGPTKRAGKTRLTKAMMPLVFAPMPVVNASPSSFFRFIAKYGGVLIIDEADAMWNGKGENAESMRGLINGGYEKGTGVLRSGDKKSGFEPEVFDIFGPRILAGIGSPPDTIEDRSIVIQMKRKMPHEEVDLLRARLINEDAWELRRRVAGAMWGQSETPLSFPPSMSQLDYLDRDEFPEGLDDRAMDQWEPLLIVAREAGGHWPDTAARAASAISGDREDSDPLISWLADLHKVFDRSRMATMVLIQRLIDLGGQWDQFNMTSRSFSDYASKFGHKAKQLKIDGANIRGYEREWFVPLWERYQIVEDTVVPQESATHLTEVGSEVALGSIHIRDTSTLHDKIVVDRALSGDEGGVSSQEALPSPTALPEHDLSDELKTMVSRLKGQT